MKQSFNPTWSNLFWATISRKRLLRTDTFGGRLREFDCSTVESLRLAWLDGLEDPTSFCEVSGLPNLPDASEDSYNEHFISNKKSMKWNVTTRSEDSVRNDL